MSPHIGDQMRLGTLTALAAAAALGMGTPTVTASPNGATTATVTKAAVMPSRSPRVSQKKLLQAWGGRRKKHKGEREKARRLRQINSRSLKRENGLAA